MKKFSLFLKFSCLFITILLVIPGCAPKMSLEEAKKISVSMDEMPIAKPSRRINDILAVLNQPGHFNVNVTERLKSQVSALPPSEANDKAMAAFYLKRGDAARQLGYMKQALDDLRMALIYSQRTGEDDPELLRHLGQAEKSAGNFQKAVDLLERSLDLKDAMSTYAQLTDAYIKTGDMETAERFSREGYDFYVQKTLKQNRQKNQSGKSVLNANAREILMSGIRYSVLEAQGRYGEAGQYLRKTLDLSLSQSMKERMPRNTINTRMQLSQNLTHQHRLMEAEIEARQAMKEALGFGGVESDLTARAVRRLAGVMLAQRRINDAEQLARAAIRILDSSSFPSDSLVMCSARMFLGNVLSRKEDFPEAMKQFDLAREGMKENADLYDTMFTRNRNLMLTLLKTGRLDEAMRIVSSDYEWNRKNFGGKHPKTIMSLGLRGMANAMAGNNRQAFEDFSSALPVLMGQDGKEDVSGRLQRAILETYIDFLGRIYGTPLEKELGIRASDEAFRIAGYLGGQSIQTALGESSARAAASYDPELSDLVRQEQDMHRQNQALQENLSDAMAAPPDQQNPEALKSEKTTIENLTRAREIILGEINRRFPKYANFTGVQPAAIDKVRESLQQNETLISIFTADEKTYVWAVPKKGEIRFSVTPLGKKELTRMVSHLRKALDPNPNTLGDIPAFDLIQAYHLYGRLLKPVDPAWEDAKDLLITVNGPLGNLPLSILPTEPFNLADEKGELFANYREVPWLIRKASVTMLPSINALVTLRSLPEGDQKRKAFAGFGDPIFNLEQLALGGSFKSVAPVNQETASGNIQIAGREIELQVRGVRIAGKGNLDDDRMISAQLDQLGRLPDTAEEIRSIARVLNADADGNVFLGKDFSQHRLKGMNLSDRRVIAFATHALVPGDLDGLDQPALAFSSPAVTGEQEDGLLTLDEILKLKLNADWVVLSACNTGASEGKGAEAVSGLGKAFFYAGTRALLVTMWSVETTSARKLVTGIFQSQEENRALSRAQALRKSMLNLIDKETLKDESTGKIAASYAHPLFWAPFIIVGDPGKSNY
jgi:CHAT domain-containing protein